MSSTATNFAIEPSASTRHASFLVLAGAISGAAVAYGGWLGGATLLVCALMARWPVQVALGMFALLLPFDSVSAIGGQATGAALTRYVGGFAAVVLLVLGLISKRLSLPSRAGLWWSLFVLWGVATLGWAANSQFAFERLPTALSLCLLYVIATAFRINKKEMQVVLVLTVIGGCVAAGMSVHEFYSGTFYLQSTRSSLMMGNRDTDPNQFGASLLLPLSLAIGAVVQGRSRKLRVCAIAAIAILSLALFLSMSRGAMAAALTVVVVYIRRLGFNRRIMLAIILLACLLLLMPQSFFARLGLSDRGAGRLDIWTASMDLVPHYGLFGAGWNNFIVAYSGIAGHAPSFRGYTRGSHSIYVGMLIEVGAIGLMFLLLAFRSQLREGKTRDLIPYAAACWGMVVMGITLDIVWRKSFWFAWIIFAMAAQMRRNRTEATAP